MNADDIVDFFTKNRYYDRFDEKNWRQEMEEHPLLMSKPPSNPDEIPPLVEAMRQLKYGEDCNTPEELAKQYKLDGNENYKQRKFNDAIASYKKGIQYLVNRQVFEIEGKSSEEGTELLSVLYSNIAACHVMQNNHQKAINDCKEALKINPENKRAKQRMRESLKSLQQASIKDKAEEEKEEAAATITNITDTNEAKKKVNKKQKSALSKEKSVP